MNRRDILKLFGVGASVVPILNGAPQLAAESKLIATPEVEPMLVPPSVIHAGSPWTLIDSRTAEMQVVFRTKEGTYYFKADTFLTESQLEHNPFLRANETRLNWTLKGICFGQIKANYSS